MPSAAAAETYDHTGTRVHHGRARVNGIRMHYITAGSSPTVLLLLHGTPKNSFYWYKLLPLLTPHFTVVAPDLRGFGYTDKPPASTGYSCLTNARDLAQLMQFLGHERYCVHGEDRGAEYAYALAAAERGRVVRLSFCEMLLTGFGLEESNVWSEENVGAQWREEGVWCWHLSFFWIPHVPEMLIRGREKEFWEFFMRQECFDPTAIEPVALEHWVECAKQPGCLTGILETYRSAWENRRINLESAKEKITIPVMTVGAPEFFGPTVRECMEKVATNVKRSEIFEECGHSLALEKPERLAKMLKEFMVDDEK